MPQSVATVDAHDASGGAPNPTRPDVARHGCGWAALVALALFAYGTLLPFDFDLSLGPWAHGRSWLHLAWSQPPPDDVIANVVVCIPLGMLLCLSLRRRVASWSLRIATTVLIISAVSLAAESLQTLIRSRVGAFSDVGLNALGGFAGALLAAPAARWLSRGRRSAAQLLRSHPATLGFVAATVLITLNSWMPFDWRSPAQGLQRADLTLTASASTSGLTNADSWRWLLDRAGDCGFLLALGFFALLSRREAGAGRIRATCGAAVRVLLLVLLWEVGQLALGSHVFSVSAIVTRLLAAGAGVCLALAMIDLPIEGTWRYAPRMLLSQPLLTACLFVQVGFLLARAMAALVDGVTGFEIQALPFYAEFHRPFLPAVASMWEQIVPYAVLALTAAACSSLRGMREVLPRVLPFVLSVSLAAEVLASLGASALFDVTDVLLALTGALAGTWMHTWLTRHAPDDRLAEPAPAATIQPKVEGDLVTVANMIPPHLAHRWRLDRRIDPQTN
jgi:glycopeptide antibiotics resistance protein